MIATFLLLNDSNEGQDGDGSQQEEADNNTNHQLDVPDELLGCKPTYISLSLSVWLYLFK